MCAPCQGVLRELHLSHNKLETQARKCVMLARACKMSTVPSIHLSIEMNRAKYGMVIFPCFGAWPCSLSKRFASVPHCYGMSGFTQKQTSLICTEGILPKHIFSRGNSPRFLNTIPVFRTRLYLQCYFIGSSSLALLAAFAFGHETLLIPIHA